MDCNHKLKIVAPYDMTINKYYKEELKHPQLRKRILNNKFYIFYDCENCKERFMKAHTVKEAKQIFDL